MFAWSYGMTSYIRENVATRRLGYDEIRDYKRLAQRIDTDPECDDCEKHQADNQADTPTISTIIHQHPVMHHSIRETDRLGQIVRYEKL